MKDYIKRPAVFAKAAAEGQGYKWYLELILFLGIYMVGAAVQSLIMLPFLVAEMFVNEEFLEMAPNGNIQQVYVLTQNMMQSNLVLLGMMIANAGLIVMTILFGKLIGKRSLASFGFVKKGAVREYLAGAAVGFVVFSAAVGICVVSGALKLSAAEDFSIIWFVLFLFGFLIQGMAEEVLCRGYFMVSFARRYSMPAAILMNSVLFSLLHLGNDGVSVLAIFNLLLYGIVASLYFIKRGNIWGVAAFHSIWNLVQGNFYGIQVSGMQMEGSVFNAAADSSKVWINGGAFGLEGGFAVTIVLVIAAAVLWMMKGKDIAEA